LGLLLLEVIVGTADERVCVLEFAVEVFSFLYVLNLDVHGERFGDKLDLVPETFDQHSGVPLHFIKAAINRFETPAMPVQSLFDPTKAFIKILYKFLLHTASAAMGTIRGSAVHVNGTQQSQKG
jgi:hypothetical protein